MTLLNRITLRTPESVELTFTLAGIGNRIYALLIDYLIWGAMLLGFLTFWAVSLERLTAIAAVLPWDEDTLRLWVIALGMVIGFGLYMGYFIGFEVGWQGQTPGKRWVKIRVIRDNGRPARLPQATLRSLLRPIDDLFFLGMVLILFGQQEKRLGDWLAGTLVVQNAPLSTATIPPPSPPVQAYAAELRTQADLDHLTPEQFATIRSYLLRSPHLSPRARHSKSQALARQAKHLLHLTTPPPPPLTDHHILAAIYWAYQGEGDRG
ncbi:RDD family protein [Spirulina major]|uniref:RDD family protein n=1 Tax=Spirulina major TaxID=270636 RepID=UPI00093410DF|nr:RDD family protein [Spirulina major]